MASGDTLKRVSRDKPNSCTNEMMQSKTIERESFVVTSQYLVLKELLIECTVGSDLDFFWFYFQRRNQYLGKGGKINSKPDVDGIEEFIRYDSDYFPYRNAAYRKSTEVRSDDPFVKLKVAAYGNVFNLGDKLFASTPREETHAV